MKIISLIMSVILLSACAYAQETKSPDCDCNGEITQAIPGTNTAVVKVSLDETGMPQVDFETVVVEWGQRIIWVGPQEMSIRFPKGSPFDETKLSTRDAVINRVMPKQKEKEIEYKYDVIVGDKVLDPRMIVRGGNQTQ